MLNTTSIFLPHRAALFALLFGIQTRCSSSSARRTSIPCTSWAAAGSLTACACHAYPLTASLTRPECAGGCEMAEEGRKVPRDSGNGQGCVHLGQKRRAGERCALLCCAALLVSMIRYSMRFISAVQQIVSCLLLSLPLSHTLSLSVCVCACVCVCARARESQSMLITRTPCCSHLLSPDRWTSSSSQADVSDLTGRATAVCLLRFPINPMKWCYGARATRCVVRVCSRGRLAPARQSLLCLC